MIINVGYKGSLEPEWCLVSDEDDPFASKIDREQLHPNHRP